jgi:hypothetical protein
LLIFPNIYYWANVKSYTKKLAASNQKGLSNQLNEEE